MDDVIVAQKGTVSSCCYAAESCLQPIKLNKSILIIHSASFFLFFLGVSARA